MSTYDQQNTRTKQENVVSSDNAQLLAISIGAALLALLFGTVGLCVYLRHKRAQKVKGKYYHNV